MHAPFDAAWFARLLQEPSRPQPAADLPGSRGQVGVLADTAEVQQDWGEAPDIVDFLDRADELHTLRG
jgi:hypothetical protein